MKAGTMLQNTCINIFHQFPLQSPSCIGVWNIVLETVLGMCHCECVCVWGGGGGDPPLLGKSKIFHIYKRVMGEIKTMTTLL